MGRIFKYELRRRRSTIFILGGIMISLALGTLLIILTGIDTLGTKGFSNFGVWIVLSFIALFFIPLAMFFTCSNGHVDELLYKDTNYLMLTIPVKSYEIIAGRIVAGFVEFLMYAIISFMFFLIFGALGFGDFHRDTITYNGSFFSAAGMILYNIFILNRGLLIYFVLTALSLFLLIGTVFICIKAFTRSFFKRKTIVEFISIIVFIFIYSHIIALGNTISKKFNLVQHIDLKFLEYHGSYNAAKEHIPVYLVTIIFTMIIAGGFFYLATWLFDKKVELY